MVAEVKRLISMELPIMHAEAGKSLAYVYVRMSSPNGLQDVLNAASREGADVRSCYVFPSDDRFAGLVLLDAGDEAVGRFRGALSGTGVEVVDSEPSRPGVAASEEHTLHVTGTPMTVMGRYVLGNTFARLNEIDAVGVYELGERTGRMAAEAVPPLLERLGVPLTHELLMERFRDFQVFGWADVIRYQADENLSGEALMQNTFEAAAWNGQAGGPQCNFIRGFIGGVFGFAGNRQMAVDENTCQAKGDEYCRFVFSPA